MYKNNLYNIRVSRGQTQKEFAEEIGINPNLYSRYERGETNMSLEVAKRIAIICNVSIDLIAGLEEPDYAEISDGQKQLKDRKENAVEDLYTIFPEESRELILEIIREELDRREKNNP